MIDHSNDFLTVQIDKNWKNKNYGLEKYERY